SLRRYSRSVGLKVATPQTLVRGDYRVGMVRPPDLPTLERGPGEKPAFYPPRRASLLRASESDRWSVRRHPAGVIHREKNLRHPSKPFYAPRTTRETSDLFVMTVPWWSIAAG